MPPDHPLLREVRIERAGETIVVSRGTPGRNISQQPVYTPEEAVRVAQWFSEQQGGGRIVRGELPPEWRRALKGYPRCTPTPVWRR